MKVLGSRRRGVRQARKGAALLLALLLLVVLIAITIQIGVGTGTDARIARNDLALTKMDLAIESALLQVGETLKVDAEAAAGAESGPAGAAGGAGGDPLAAASAAPAAGAEEPPEACDSRKDEWASPQRTEINEIRLRIIVQDEDSKYNVLNLLAEDEKEAQAALERVTRIIDLAREGSRDYDFDPRQAEDMAKAMLEHMRRRDDSDLPRPSLLTDREQDDRGMPLSIEEFGALEAFGPTSFKDFRDAEGKVVHSLGSFLTVWSSPGVAGDLPATAASAGAVSNANAAAGGANAQNTSGTGTSGTGSSGTGSSGSGTSGGRSSTGRSARTSQTTGSGQGAAGASGSGAQSGQGGAGAGAPGAPTGSGGADVGGYAVNLNTAPAAVLKGLFDDREIHPSFFDALIEYRNLEEEEPKDSSPTAEEEEPQLDEYGQPVLDRRVFESLDELSEVRGHRDLATEAQQRLRALFTTKSSVFSVYVVARLTTAAETGDEVSMSPAELRKREETSGDALVRVVRSVVWRREIDGEIVLVPLTRWQVLDYLPYEVLDFPPEDR